MSAVASEMSFRSHFLQGSLVKSRASADHQQSKHVSGVAFWTSIFLKNPLTVFYFTISFLCFISVNFELFKKLVQSADKYRQKPRKNVGRGGGGKPKICYLERQRAYSW
jgi:hypothetical protein